MSYRERSAEVRAAFIPYDVRYLAESYRLGLAWWITCQACLARYVSLAIPGKLPTPCPSCNAPLAKAGAIGIYQAVAIIAANRQASTIRTNEHE